MDNEFNRNVTKECDDMKKTIGMTALLFLMMGLIGCNGETANIDSIHLQGILLLP